MSQQSQGGSGKPNFKAYKNGSSGKVSKQRTGERQDKAYKKLQKRRTQRAQTR